MDSDVSSRTEIRLFSALTPKSGFFALLVNQPNQLRTDHLTIPYHRILEVVSRQVRLQRQSQEQLKCDGKKVFISHT